MTLKERGRYDSTFITRYSQFERATAKYPRLAKYEAATIYKFIVTAVFPIIKGKGK